MKFIRCSRCGKISIDNDWSGTVTLMVCGGRTYHLCESCGSEVLNYILEGADELGADKEENDEGV